MTPRLSVFTMTPRLSHKGSASQQARDVKTASVANPAVRPPLVVLASLLSGAVLNVAWPLSFFPHALRLPVGCVLLAMAAALFAYSIRRFRMAGTPVPGNKPTTAIVRTGPLQSESNLPGVLRLAPWRRDLGQQPVAGGHVGRDRCHHRRRRGSARRAVPDRAVRYRVPGIQSLRASLAMNRERAAAIIALAVILGVGCNSWRRLWLPCQWTRDAAAQARACARAGYVGG